MKQNLRVSLGAVVLALATLAALIFALLNFDQRTRYDQIFDGVTWIDTEQGVQARNVCSICLSACLFLFAAGTPRAPYISIFSAWLRSFSGRSTTAASWTCSIGKSIGRKSWRVCWCPLFCCTSLWFFPAARNRSCAPRQSCYRSMFCRSDC